MRDSNYERLMTPRLKLWLRTAVAVIYTAVVIGDVGNRLSDGRWPNLGLWILIATCVVIDVAVILGWIRAPRPKT